MSCRDESPYRTEVRISFPERTLPVVVEDLTETRSRERLQPGGQKNTAGFFPFSHVIACPKEQDRLQCILP